MVANAWHECKERNIINAIGTDVPIRLESRWVVMVHNFETDSDTEVPIAYCPWCGLNLKTAYQSKSRAIQRQKVTVVLKAR